MQAVNQNAGPVQSLSLQRTTLYLAIAIIIATYYKIWLADAYYLRAVFAPHDDNHFVTLASYILNGDWLGRYDQYNQYTLMKGLVYPLWIGFCNILGVPLLTAQQLLYSLACTVFIIALSRDVKNKAWLLLIFLLLFFNPFTLIVDRVFRLGIYPSLTLLVIASAYGLYRTMMHDKHNALAWSVVLGLSLAAFWHTREEAIWILPSLLVFVTFAIYQGWSGGQRNLVRIGGLYLLPVVLVVLATLLLAGLNWYHYGVFRALEINSPEFESAYAGLLRIKTDHWIRFYPVTREARIKAYAVSPAFRELQPYLEGDLGKRWQGHRPDIPAAYFIWALRDAVQRAGYYNFRESAEPKDIKQTYAFYRRMGDELATACDDGRLDCARLLSPFMPPWREEYTRLLLPTYLNNIRRLVTFDQFDYRREGQYSIGKHPTLELFKTVTNEIVEVDRESLRTLRPEFFKKRIEARKKTIRNIRNNVYHNLAPPLFLLFLLLVPVSAIRELLRRNVRPVTVLGLSALAALLSNMAIVSLVQITSYTEIGRAMYPGYVALLVFIVAGFLVLLQQVRDWQARKADDSDRP